ncbi:MAG: hypothetical protein ACRENI_11365 [Gemmatimonadaceae bacterium]
MTGLADPPASEAVGWYETAPDHKVLVTWAPASEQLRMLDFDSARFIALRPSGDSVAYCQLAG